MARRHGRMRGEHGLAGDSAARLIEAAGLKPRRTIRVALWSGEEEGLLGSLAYGAGGWEQASIRMLPTGKVEVVTGSSAHGQGHETAWSQIVADQLGVPFEDIRVLHGDTQVSPRGMDTYGSRSLAVGGMALVMACDKVIDKARVIAAGMLEASADDLEWSPGRFAVRGDPDAFLYGHPDLAAGVTGAELVAAGGDLGAEVDVLEVHRDLGHL